MFCFIFSSVLLGENQDIEFEPHDLPLHVGCISRPFKMTIHHFGVFFFVKGYLLFLSALSFL